MQKRHVVLLKSKAQNAGGLEKYASRIASAFAENHHRVTILTTGDLPPAQTAGAITFHSVQTSKWPAFLRMEQFDRYVQSFLQKESADLVFGMDRNRFQTHIRAGNGVHLAFLKSRILTEGIWKYRICLCNPMHRKILEIEKHAFENPELKKLFTNSHMVKNQILEHYHVDPKKIEVIHNGVEWHEMQFAFDEKENAKKTFMEVHRMNPHAFHFLFIGSGFLRKGLRVLLHALSKIRHLDFHLSIVGKDSKQSAFYKEAMHLKLQDKVRFFGAIQDPTPFYQMADCLIIPSFYDPFANVTIEALAMGLFTASSRQNGGHEIITKQNGVIIDSLQNLDSVIAAMEVCLQNPKTKKSAQEIRNSVSHLDFSKQLDTLLKESYG